MGVEHSIPPHCGPVTSPRACSTFHCPQLQLLVQAEALVAPSVTKTAHPGERGCKTPGSHRKRLCTPLSAAACKRRGRAGDRGVTTLPGGAPGIGEEVSFLPCTGEIGSGPDLDRRTGWGGLWTLGDAAEPLAWLGSMQAHAVPFRMLGVQAAAGREEEGTVLSSRGHMPEPGWLSSK